MRKRIILWTALAVLILGVTLLLWANHQWQNFLKQPLTTNNRTLIYKLKTGTSVKTVARDLQRMGLIKHSQFFVLLARFKNKTRHLQAGEYRISAGLTAPQLLKKMVNGEVNYYKFTIVEGWTFKELMHAIEKNPHITHDLQANNAKQIAVTLGLAHNNPEGLFFPSTYRFTADTSDISILKRANEKMRKLLQQDWQQRSARLPYKNSYQALIVASMIEKETALNKEKPIIAGVIVRRLKSRMLLQIDATVIYGVNKKGNEPLTKKDLRNRSPYNTYRHRGLPPTPIAMPGAQSIWAALHPKRGRAMYYVAKGNGSHYFSANLAQHKQAVNQYLRGK